MTLLDVIEAVDGPLHWTMPESPENETAAVGQRLQAACDLVVEGTRRQWQGITVAELAGRRRK